MSEVERTPYRTVVADLAAAIVTAGEELLSVETDDGVTCVFVFPDKVRAEALADKWKANELNVDAMALTRNVKKVYRMVRQAQAKYAKERVAS